MPVGVGVAEAAHAAGELRGEHHAHGDGGAVAPGVAFHQLDGVAQGVAVVQDFPEPGFLEVLGDHLGLDGDGTFDQFAEGVRTADP